MSKLILVCVALASFVVGTLLLTRKGEQPRQTQSNEIPEPPPLEKQSAKPSSQAAHSFPEGATPKAEQSQTENLTPKGKPAPKLRNYDTMNTVRGLKVKRLYDWSKDRTLISLKGTLVDVADTGITDVELVGLNRNGSEVTTVKLQCSALKETDCDFTGSFLLKNDTLAQIVRWEKKNDRSAYWKPCETCQLKLKTITKADRGREDERTLFSIRAEVFNPTTEIHWRDQELAFQALDRDGFELGCFKADTRADIDPGRTRVITMQEEGKLPTALLSSIAEWKLIPSQTRFPHGFAEDDR